MTTKEIMKKFNKLFEECRKNNIEVILAGDAMNGDRIEEAFMEKDKKIIHIW